MSWSAEHAKKYIKALVHPKNAIHLEKCDQVASNMRARQLAHWKESDHVWESHERRTIIFLLELKVQRAPGKPVDHPAKVCKWWVVSCVSYFMILVHCVMSISDAKSCCRDASTEFVGIAASSSIQAASNTDAKLSCFCRELRHRPAGAFTKKCTNDGNKKGNNKLTKDLKKLQVQQRSWKCDDSSFWSPESCSASRRSSTSGWDVPRQRCFTQNHPATTLHMFWAKSSDSAFSQGCQDSTTPRVSPQVTRDATT